jgi:hypothetical protein
MIMCSWRDKSWCASVLVTKADMFMCWWQCWCLQYVLIIRADLTCWW